MLRAAQKQKSPPVFDRPEGRAFPFTLSVPCEPYDEPPVIIDVVKLKICICDLITNPHHPCLEGRRSSRSWLPPRNAEGFSCGGHNESVPSSGSTG